METPRFKYKGTSALSEPNRESGSKYVYELKLMLTEDDHALIRQEAKRRGMTVMGAVIEMVHERADGDSLVNRLLTRQRGVEKVVHELLEEQKLLRSECRDLMQDIRLQLPH